ncbi:MAG: methylenetetrahydrofolate reductase [Paracoccaceae bacterium]|nr:methylenetetrahydrofolate reductase [Paracoccaceae bacterium]
MAVVAMKRRQNPRNGALENLLRGFSIEVMPRTAARIDDFRTLLPRGTRIYLAHIDGTPFDDMLATARRLSQQGFAVMPHFPARLIRDRAMLAEWIDRYRHEAGVDQALVLAGGVSQPQGAFDNSMEMLDTGLFDDLTRIHVAGHPEGNRDVAPNGAPGVLLDALRWKQDFARRKGLEMAIVTQFAFESAPVIKWANSLVEAGITLPVHLGVAGPAKLQTLIRFAIACGVGPSLRVLQKRARDVRKLLLPFAPDDFLNDIAAHKAAHPDLNISHIHFFPLGGIKAAAEWARDHGGDTAQPDAQD